MHVRNVAEAQRCVCVFIGKDDQDAALVGETKIGNCLGSLRGLWSIESEGVNNDDLAISSTVRKCRVQSELDHLLRGFLAVITGLWAVSNAAATPLRRADRALTSPAGALLTPWLCTATTPLSAGLGGVCTSTTSCELCGDDLVHYRNVWRDAKDVVREIGASGRLSRKGVYVDVCH